MGEDQSVNGGTFNGSEPNQDGRWHPGTPATAVGEASPVMAINYGAKIAQVSDGTSSTVMFNEVRAGLNASDLRGTWAIGLGGASLTTASAVWDAVTPNDTEDGADDIETCNSIGLSRAERRRLGMDCSQTSGNWQAQARSQHVAGVNVGFCDGGVRTVNEDVDNQIWFNINSATDGQPFVEF